MIKIKKVFLFLLILSVALEMVSCNIDGDKNGEATQVQTKEQSSTPEVLVTPTPSVETIVTKTPFCTSSPVLPITPTLTPTTPLTTAPTPTPTPVYVYEGAVEDYLLPIEDHSWERIYAPEFVMIHFMSAVVNHRDDPYNMVYIRDNFLEYDISIHYVVDRDGTVYCYIPEDRVAWHAGKGEYDNNEKYTNAMNQYAIGIEVLAIGSETDMAPYLRRSVYRALDDSLKGYTEAQYEALEKLVDDICRRNGIPKDSYHVIGHQDYSSGKTDPGELFDWSRVLG